MGLYDINSYTQGALWLNSNQMLYNVIANTAGTTTFVEK